MEQDLICDGLKDGIKLPLHFIFTPNPDPNPQLHNKLRELTQKKGVFMVSDPHSYPGRMLTCCPHFRCLRCFMLLF